jgi:murein DD-endopeptidase MepM/ murein hydrolase activator NlpD
MNVIRALFVGFAALAPAASSAGETRLQLPVACEVGRTCFIQNYVDHDPGPGARDFACGTLTYQGHNGTDFRVPTLVDMNHGVAVLAAAPGQVKRIRDGVPDISVRAREANVEGAECGNGIVIAHEDGLETQYCHLQRGSVRVKPGDRVGAGYPIGRIGLSGLTEFPHLHFTVRYNGRIIDPFAVDLAPGACGEGLSLWSESASKALAYRPSAVLNRGFAADVVTMQAIEMGDADEAVPGRDAPAIVAFIRAIGLQAGDVQHLSLAAPGGRILAEDTGSPLDGSKAQVFKFVGSRRPASGWPAGTYAAHYEVIRSGEPVINETFTLELE